MELLKISNKLLLRKLQISDAIDIFNTLNRHRDYFSEWLPFLKYTQTVADSEMFVGAMMSENAQSENLVYTINYDKVFVGLIAYKNIDFINKVAEIGYWLSADYQKKGIVTQCVEFMVGHAFNKLNLNRIQIKCAVGNIKSSNIPKRLNFKFEGIEREGEYYDDDLFFDIEVYSILKKEWK